MVYVGADCEAIRNTINAAIAGTTAASVVSA